MKEFNKSEFDEIFRAGLLAPDLNEVDEDWELMKARIQNARNRTLAPYYLFFISSAAAILMMVFSVFLNSDELAPDQAAVIEGFNEKTFPAVQGPLNVPITSGSVPEKTPFKAAREITLNPEVIYFNELNTLKEAAMPVQNGSEYLSQSLTVPAEATFNTAPINQPVIAESVNAESTLALSGMINAENPTKTEDVSWVGDLDEEVEKSNPSKSRLSLAINFAPDLNGVEQIQSNKISYSLGAGLIYNISNKLSIEAGAAYGRKSYQTGFSSFKPASDNLFQVKPNVVSSGFDVMDLQLNLAYTLLKKGKSSIGVGAGISSYLMLDEQYSFTYPNVNARGLSSFHTGYQNNHFLGIANLNLSYKRNLTNNVKLAFNPYLKLPLTELGYGNIRLRSAGMSVGVITNLNKSNK